MNMKLTSSHWRLALLASGALLVLLSIGLPVDRIVDRAISPQVMNEIKARGTPERITELQNQFRSGLHYFRLSAAMLGIWLVALASQWKRIASAGREVRGNAALAVEWGRNEIIFSLLWALLVFGMATPLIFKGFEHTEAVVLEMVAKRGPLVSVACQNLPPRVVQPAYSFVESLFVKAFGSSEAVARLPALFFGAMTVLPFYFLARRFGSVWFANMACAGLAVTGFFLFYATYGRGSSLALLAYVCCLLLAVSCREDSRWWKWWALGAAMVVACYAHLASGFFLAGLVMVLTVERMITAHKRNSRISAVFESLIQPLAVFGTVFWTVFLLYSVGIPAELKYMRTFSPTDYYTAFHVDMRFLKTVVESWAFVRDVSPLAWAQAILFLVGLAVALYRFPQPTVYVAFPAVLFLAFIWSRGMVIYPRYILHILPLYVLFSVLAAWQVLSSAVKLGPKCAATILLIGLTACGLMSARRLYRMERCGVRTAISDATAVMRGDNRLMGTLDGYVTVKHYYPTAVSAYKSAEFWNALNASNPPEFAVVVPYLDYDIPGGWNALRRKYELFKAYRSWLDVYDDQDTVYLYRLKTSPSPTAPGAGIKTGTQ